MKLYTIGYAQKSAEELFKILQMVHVRKILDVRLKNANSYCFYTHKRDFPFFLGLVGIDYEHKLEWAPDAPLLDGFKAGNISWAGYVSEFKKIIERRNIIRAVTPEYLDGCALMCAEPTPEMCHRRLLAEYFKAHFPELSIVHL